ncbi:MAG: hypothetical protein V2A61_02890 [Calditrichota bacterium]
MASKNGNQAFKALDVFYQSGFNRLQNTTVKGIFVSDCGVLFVRADIDPDGSLKELLQIIEAINKDMIEKDCMLTTSIAYGPFRYQRRIVFDGVEKNLLLGNAYLSAYLDSNSAKPKIEPGMCRIVKYSLPAMLLENIGINHHRIAERARDPKHLYFYWMIQDGRDIARFEEMYSDSYQRIYGGMIDALKHFSNL